MDNSLGNRLEEIKKNERLSVAEYMRLCETTKTAYYNWKKGTNSPNSDVLVNVLKKYPHYSADWLLLGRGDMYYGKSKQQVSDASQDYGNLRKEIEDLSKEVKILQDKIKPKDEIIRHQGEMLAGKSYDLSSQKIHKTKRRKQ